MKQNLIRIVAALLVVLMIFSISSTTISYALDELLTEKELETQGVETTNKSVEFDVYYEDEKHSKTEDLLTEGVKLNLKIKVKDAGYLENTTVDFSDSNFKIGTVQTPELVKEIDNKIITLNKINGGDTIIVEVTILPDIQEKVPVDFYSKDNSIKLTGTFINENGKELNISGNKILHLSWNKDNAQADLQQEIEKYIKITAKGQEGILLAENISSCVEKNMIATKTSLIEIDVPQIEKELPEEVFVILNSSDATNGGKSEFTQDNWEYNEEDGKLVIRLSNEADSDGNITWMKDVKDNFTIIYHYSDKALKKVAENEVSINLDSKITYTLFDDTRENLIAESHEVIKLTEQIGSLIDFKVEFIQDTINKGYMYTNLIAADENKKETIFDEIYTLTISDADLVDDITIEPKAEKIISQDREYSADEANNRRILINKEQLMEILGEEGTLTISVGEETESIISKDTETETNGISIIDLTETDGNITMQMSKPIKEGRIEFIIEKSILENTSYGLETIRTWNSIQSNTAVSLENNIPVNVVEGKVSFEEPTAKSNVTISKDSFSTVSENNELELALILETNSEDDILYKNPAINVKIPSYITEMNITNCQLLYTEELEIASSQIVDTGDGKVLVIHINGTQTTYNENVTTGPTIVINANIEIEKLTPSKKSEFIVVYSNENEEEVHSIAKEINFVAPTGIVTVNELSNYANDVDKLTLISGEEHSNVAYIDTYTNSKLAEFKGQVINNYSNDISETKILGRIPNATMQENSFDTKLYNGIAVSEEEATVFYSENANADTDLSNANNMWTTTVSDFSKIQSYMIVPNSNMAQGTGIQFKMNLVIPDNLTFQNTDKLNYEVSYVNNSSVGNMSETLQGNEIVMTTGAGPVLEMDLAIDEKVGTTLKQSQHATMIATIKNTGSDANNVVLTADQTYGRVQKINNATFSFTNSGNTIYVGDIKAGETKTVSYIYTLKSDAELGEKEIKASLTADRISQPIEFAKTMTIEKGYLDLINISAKDNDELLKGGQEVPFLSIIKNTSTETLTNFTINYALSNGAKIETAGTKTYEFSGALHTENVVIDAEKNVATYHVSSLEPGEKIIFSVTAKAQNVADNVRAVAYTEGENIGRNYSNIVSRNIEHTDGKFMAIENGNTTDVGEEKEISYRYHFENTGNLDLNMVYFKAQIPEGAKFNKAILRYRHNGKDELVETENIANNTVKLYCPVLGVNEEATIEILLTTELFSEEEIKKGITEKELSMYVEVSSELLENVKSDAISYYVAYNPAIHDQYKEIADDLETKQQATDESQQDPSRESEENNKENNKGNNKEDNKSSNQEEPTKQDNNAGEEKTYRISGKVWLDENKNDKQDENEKGINNITVKIIDIATMDFVKNSNQKDLELKTADDGSYVFSGLRNGKYVVVFDYENTKYNIAQYKVEGVSNTLNSDAIEKVITVDKNQMTVGLTDTLEIADSNIRNIDLGLSIASKFDVELTKRVSKITVNNQNGIEDYDYSSNPKQLGKVEIKDKYLESSTVIVEYTITVKNTGDVNAYVRSIVDYIPEELKFNSELNTDWYLGNDGNAYNMSLANKALKPGESQDVVIILSKKMTTDNTGLMNNDAEIFDVYNVEGIKNINAEAGNKNKSENDMSSAGMIVSVKTGETVAKYTALIVAAISILMVGIYFIKTKILDKKM